MFGSMTSKLLYKCIINKLKINKEISSNIVVEQIIPNNYNNVIEQSKNIVLKACSSYKLSDLQDIANKFNISITKDVNGKTKNKTKQTLYDELKNM